MKNSCILRWILNHIHKPALILMSFLLFYYYVYGANLQTTLNNGNALVLKGGGKDFPKSEYTTYRNQYWPRKLILLWNIPVSVSRPLWLDGGCGNCEITEDRSRIAGSDAIVIHYRETYILPPKTTRTTEQMYVWLCKESPKNIKKRINLDIFDEYYFNATMTHRRNSDIFMPYLKNVNEFPPRIEVLEKNLTNLVKEKKKVAAWIVSHCGGDAGTNYRQNYIEQMIKAGLKVDRFGKCFPNNEIPKYKTKESFEVLRQYKFYLAFENTLHCRDYISEKFWVNAIYSGSVPVVWGPSKKDVAEMAPPNSFIFVEDFDTPADLVAHLNHLNDNDEAYLKHLEWRNNLEKFPKSMLPKQDNYDGQSLQLYGYCALCRKLQSREMHSSVRSLKDWWYNSENECLNDRR